MHTTLKFTLRCTMLLMFCVLCASMSCRKATPVTGTVPAITMAENSNRAALGLREVKTNWFIYNVEFGEEKWKITRDGYEAKKIYRDSDNKIQWEEDYYYTGRTFREFPDSPQGWEMLTVHYDYTTRELNVYYVGIDPAISALMTKITPASTMSNKLSVANDILSKWGIPR
jgi:hypothetical protein